VYSRVTTSCSADRVFWVWLLALRLDILDRVWVNPGIRSSRAVWSPAPVPSCPVHPPFSGIHSSQSIRSRQPRPTHTVIFEVCYYLKTVFTFRSVAWKLAQSFSTSITGAAAAAARVSSPPSIHPRYSVTTISSYHISLFLSSDSSSPSLSFLCSCVLLELSL
jgi:hypothetical protein